MSKILLVEDDNNLREIYEARLQAEGYDIVSARDGEEALVVAKAEKPDLVISDVMMPKISGFEMLDILRNTEGLKDVKVVMLTALGQTEDQQRANKLGADRYLVKSQVTLEDIVKAAHDLLGDEAAATTAKDDKLMNDAVNSLVSGTDDKTAAPSAAQPAPAGPVVASPADDSPTTNDDSGSNQVPVAHKKVIHPIDTGPSKDIHALLAEEEAKEAKQAAGESTTPIQAAPAVQPEPTATAPEPTMATPPAPTAASDDANKDAPSAAKEEATMDAKIEDFVAGASSEPTPPTAQTPAQPSVTPPPATAPPVPPAPASQPASAPTMSPTSTPAPTPPPAAPATPKTDNQNPSSPPPDPNIIAL